jgi:hypothetical protein
VAESNWRAGRPSSVAESISRQYSRGALDLGTFSRGHGAGEVRLPRATRIEACARATVPRCRAGQARRTCPHGRDRLSSSCLYRRLPCLGPCSLPAQVLQQPASASLVMVLLVLLASLLLAAAISVVFLPATLRLLVGLVGHRLRHSSRTRRELLLDRVAAETRSFEAAPAAKSREDDDWERVGAPPTGRAVNGGAADADWNGIVGFFHPFW